MDAFGGLVPFKEDKNILGVLYMSTLFKNRAPEGGALFTIFSGGMRKAYLANLPEIELKTLIASDFKEMMGLAEFNPDLFELHYYKQAIAQYGADSEARLETISILEKENKGLFIAGSMRDGVGIADRVKQAKEITSNLKKEDKPNYYDWNGGIGSKQMEWLEKELQKANDKKRNVVIFCHYPLLPIGAHSLWNTEEVIEILNNYKCVRAWINGHNHAGNYTMNNDIHYITLQVMVDTDKDNAFAIISISDMFVEENMSLKNDNDVWCILQSNISKC